MKSEGNVWTCEIGPTSKTLPDGADGFMRFAVEIAYGMLTGEETAACFSGWGEKFTEMQSAIIENRDPDYDVVRAEFVRKASEAGMSSYMDVYLLGYQDALNGITREVD